MFKPEFFNKNAIHDARHDAYHNLGNRNNYNPGSASWRKYEEAYAKAFSRRITPEKVTEFENGKFCAEASELGLSPGFFPKLIGTDLGNKWPFEFRFFTECNVAIYQQRNGSIMLHVIND